MFVLAGSEILRTALLDPRISHVTVLARRAPPTEALPPSSSFPSSSSLESKYTYVKHTDFKSYPSDLLARLKDHNAVIWALGRSTRGMDKKEYEELTHDFPVEALKAFAEAGVGRTDTAPGLRFVYVSGSGADSSGTSRILFARVKGRTEVDLATYASQFTSVPYPVKVHNIRPAYFFPTHPVDRLALRSSFERFMDPALRGIINVVAPSAGQIPVHDLAKAAIAIALGEAEGEGTIENKRLQELGKA